MTPPDPCPLPAIWSDKLVRERLVRRDDGVVVVRWTHWPASWVAACVQAGDWSGWSDFVKVFEIEFDDVRACVVWALMTEAERAEVFV